MRKILKTAVLFLVMAMALSCNKDNSTSGPLSGTWAVSSKISGGPNLTEAEEFVSNLGFIVFSGNTVTFRGDNNEELAKGTYSITTPENSPDSPEGMISFSGVPLKGGVYRRVITTNLETMSWHDIDDILIAIKKL